MATYAKSGYGQVEPNHLLAMRTGAIYAQLPAATSVTTLENGVFMKYDYVAGEANFNTASGTGEWLLHMSEIKLYEPRQFAADFRLAAADTSDGKIYPRLYKTNVGDIITTNQVKDASGYVAGSTLTVGSTGVLEIDATPTATEMVWKVINVTATMPDGKAAVKIQRVQ